MNPGSPAAYLAVGAGGAVGSILRYAIAVAMAKSNPANPFLAVLVVNLIGSFAIGLVAGAFADRNQAGFLLLAVGVLGGFTTFSSYSLDLLTMVRQEMYGQAAFYALSQVVLGLLFAALGFWLTSKPA